MRTENLEKVARTITFLVRLLFTLDYDDKFTPHLKTYIRKARAMIS